MTNRDEAITEIKRALKARSGKTWSVTGGRGTAYSWITITVPPSKRDMYGYMSKADSEELANLLGLDRAVHSQGADIDLDGRDEYVARANGKIQD